MLQLALVCALALTPQPILREDPPPVEEVDAKLVERRLAAIDAALASGETQAISQALRESTDAPHPDVVERAAKALRHKEDEVRHAALDALRFLEHPRALVALHKAYKKERRKKQNDVLLAHLLKAVGQHGDESSIAILLDDPYDRNDRDVVRARILGLGNIRSARSVEALIDMMELVSESRVQRYMNEFRTSLILLTVTDQGPTVDRWVAWWNDNDKGFVVPPEAPRLPQPLGKLWRYYWGLGGDDERRERREDRGGSDG